MNLINISGNTFYIRGGTNTGLYLFDDNSALIIDPGLSGARPNKIIKIFCLSLIASAKNERKCLGLDWNAIYIKYITDCCILPNPFSFRNLFRRMYALYLDLIMGHRTKRFFNGREKWAKGFENQRV